MLHVSVKILDSVLSKHGLEHCSLDRTQMDINDVWVHLPILLGWVAGAADCPHHQAAAAVVAPLLLLGTRIVDDYNVSDSMT